MGFGRVAVPGPGVRSGNDERSVVESVCVVGVIGSPGWAESATEGAEVGWPATDRASTGGPLFSEVGAGGIERATAAGETETRLAAGFSSHSPQNRHLTALARMGSLQNGQAFKDSSIILIDMFPNPLFQNEIIKIIEAWRDSNDFS
jgi:hypothetical protein